ncbi:hypothetical protein B0H34DRAFT_701811 [Crassisporium funariophilum]|nr:hypothetical protein B0H34DRAFT_701811 [Crassisporium funariophilum]
MCLALGLALVWGWCVRLSPPPPFLTTFPFHLQPTWPLPLHLHRSGLSSGVRIGATPLAHFNNLPTLYRLPTAASAYTIVPAYYSSLLRPATKIACTNSIPPLSNFYTPRLAHLGPVIRMLPFCDVDRSDTLVDEISQGVRRSILDEMSGRSRTLSDGTQPTRFPATHFFVLIYFPSVWRFSRNVCFMLFLTDFVLSGSFSLSLSFPLPLPFILVRVHVRVVLCSSKTLCSSMSRFVFSHTYLNMLRSSSHISTYPQNTTT